MRSHPPFQKTLFVFIFFAAALSKQISAQETIAHRLLAMDAQVRPVSDESRLLLDRIIDDACASIRALHRKPIGRWDRAYAEKSLRSIDDTLLRHGFVYPDTGAVDLLSDSLAPFDMPAARRHAFTAHPHNDRRSAMISSRFPGPFHLADCDTASFIYLAIAERLKLPIHLVVIPSFNRQPGHTFVRWREGRHVLDWETMDGREAPERFYSERWKITRAEIEAKSALAELSTDGVLACEHYLRAVQHERAHRYGQALKELSRAIELNPQNLDARRQFAWIAATGADPKTRRPSEAVAHAQFVLRQVDDPDLRDTLAAAHAASGNFDLAVKEERAALIHAERLPSLKSAYERRLQLYMRHTPYLEPASPP